MKINEVLVYLRAEIKDLTLALSNVDCKDGLAGINIASLIANDIRNDIDSLRLAWLSEHGIEVNDGK